MMIRYVMYIGESRAGVCEAARNPSPEPRLTGVAECAMLHRACIPPITNHQ